MKTIIWINVKNLNRVPGKSFLLVLLLFFWGVSDGVTLYADDGRAGHGVVLISSEIKPFIEMVEGLEAHLSTPLCRVFIDEKGRPYSPDPLFKKLTQDLFSFVVAVGPQALSWLTKNGWDGPIFYGMVLNPDEFVFPGKDNCGVSMDLFSSRQLHDLQSVFPSVKRLGVFLNPDQNSIWRNLQKAALPFTGLDLVPIAVSSESEIRGALKKINGIDAIYFIPDATITSPLLIQYIIKQAIAQGVPAIGFNSFFYKSGAALSFSISYPKVGKQVAGMVDEFFMNRNCQSRGPEYKILMNKGVVRLLKLSTGEPLPENLEQQ